MTDPRTAEPRATPLPLRHRAIPLERLPSKLLYVEDDDDLRDMIAATFVDAGFDVTPVNSAEGALEHLTRNHYDIVVTDFNLTGKTGGWLLQQASAAQRLEGTVAIVLTSERSPPGVEGYRVLRKPIDFGILLSTIAEAVGQILPAPVVNIGAPRPSELELVLYVTTTSQESHRAIRNVHRALKCFDASRFRLTIIDVAHGGDDEWYQSLEDDRVIVTPTLVRHKPAPKTWIVGTLSPKDALEDLLESSLGPPNANG